MSFGNDMTIEQLELLRQRYSLVNPKDTSAKCLHKACRECGGTGTKKNGSGMCFHAISCPCSNCSFTC